MGYWPAEDYPYNWPGEIHRASELEDEWSQWDKVANYTRLGNVWLSIPRP